MNTCKSAYKNVLAAILCATIAGVAASASAQDKEGFVTALRVKGQVSYSLGPNQPQYPLVAGKFLDPGSIIYTKEDGIADLVVGKTVELPQATEGPTTISEATDSAVRGYVSYKPSVDQNSIRLMPNSTLAIDKLTVSDTGSDTVSDTELDLQKGKIFASVHKLSGASQYIIKLPNGVAGVRGTMFSLSADGAVACFESTGGGVVLALTLPGGASQTFLIGPGEMLDPSTGAPVQLTPQMMSALHRVFNALRTSYYADVSFDSNFNNTRISPTTGTGFGVAQ
jgi:hypothetical protein